MLKHSSVRRLHESNGFDDFSLVKKCEETAGYRNTLAGFTHVREITTIVVERKKIPNSKCCSEYILTVSCVLCGIFTKFITENTRWNIKRDIVESVENLHKHTKVLVLSNGKDYQELISNVKNIGQFKGMRILCGFCNKTVVGVDELIESIKNYRHGSLDTIMKDLSRSYNLHLTYDECIKNLDSHKANIDNLIDRVNGILDVNKIIRNDEYFPPYYDKEYVGMIIEHKKCYCGSKFVTTCNICGISRKDDRGYVSSYELCAKRHLTKTPKMNIRDVLTPINPKIVGTCTCVTEKDVETHYMHRRSGNNCSFFMKCDGYICAICGVEYADNSKKMPPRAVVLGHLKKCIEENKESTRRYGQYCV